MSEPICPCCGYDFDQDEPIERGIFKMFPYGNPTVRGVSVKMTEQERALLWSVLKANGRVVSRDVIYSRLDLDVDPKIIDVVMCRVRRKLRVHGIDTIRTEWGRGYRWEWPAALAMAA
jgi:DNA-binding response OmpR family regulator